MKKVFFPLLCILSVACTDYLSDEVPTDESTENQQFIELNEVQQNIMANIYANKFGGYSRGKVSSRAIDEVTLTPYVEDGDTVLYIAQYDEGWEIYSAKRCTNMLLYSCDHGTFKMSMDMPDALRDLLANTIDNIHNIPAEMLDSIHPSWGAPAISREELAKGKITNRLKVTSRGGDEDVDESDRFETEIEEGDWVLLEQTTVQTSSYDSGKLITTKWGQPYPWNIYTPLKYNSSSGEMENSLAGCGPVAVSQYLYYTHYKDNIPASTISTATLDTSTYIFSFSGNSSTIFDQMALTFTDSGANYSALFIGYIGQQLSANYGLDETTTLRTSYAPLLNTYYANTDIIHTLTTRNYSDISNSIRNGYPLISRAGNSDRLYGHAFLIDRLRTNSYRTTYLYGWEGPYLDSLGNWVDTNEYDDEGNIIGWAITNEITRTSSSSSISMNWGWEGLYDDVWFQPLGDWAVGLKEYNDDFFIVKRSDIN